VATAADAYGHIVSAMTGLGYTQWTKALSFREVPEASADKLFVVVPSSTDPQLRLLGVSGGSHTIDTSRKWRISVLFRAVDSVITEVMKLRVLPAEEAITDALLALTEAVSATATYLDSDDAGGLIVLTIELATRYDRAS